jgi:thioredoxin 1
MSMKPNTQEAGSENESHVLKKRKSKIKVLRILIPILVVLTIAGIYILKNPGGIKAEFDLDATKNFDLDAILSRNLPVIIDFGADTCIPCQEMAPILLELNQELRGKAIVKFVDVRKNSAAGQEVPLEVIPTQFFFNADGSPYVPANKEAAAANGFIMYTIKATGKHVYTAHQGGLDKDTIMTILKEMGMK